MLAFLACLTVSQSDLELLGMIVRLTNALFRDYFQVVCPTLICRISSGLMPG